MKSSTDFESGQWQSNLRVIATAVRTLAQSYQSDSLVLLALLRHLEELHREIRDGLFQASLPDNRQDLHKLLKDIEAEGGWPYIERMKLQLFLAKLLAEDAEGGGEVGEAEAEPCINLGDSSQVEYGGR